MSDAHPFDNALAEAEKIEEKLNKIELRFQNEKAKLTGKFELEKASLYKERAECVNKIDGFWSIVLQTAGVIDGLLMPGDEEAFSHLTGVMVERDESNPADFKIVLSFAENEFFTNTEISKSFKLEEERYTTTKAEIDWKEGKSLIITKDEDDADEDDVTTLLLPGFFTWFASEEDPLNLGAQIANDIFPDAISLFNSATSDDMDDDISDVDEEEDIEDTEDEEDEEDAPAPKKHKK
ncbi:hypothetical protein BDF22DRAFT_680579 [Syncephalis plumigaleata]|nr:hypothetical protein BDF22DRAFT_680579 [Syncephalis plumigaleata]